MRDWGVGIADIEQARTPLFTTGSQERSGMGFTIMESFMDTVTGAFHPGQGDHGHHAAEDRPPGREMNAPALPAGELLAAARAGDSQACEQVLRENNGLIWSVVRRYYGRGVEPDDLYQLGCLGFLKAVRGFDPDYGTQFSTYAVPKIAGEIRRFLRDDGPVKVSRGLKERSAAVRGAQSRLAARLGREPTISELSAETGLEPEDIAAAETAAEPVLSLQSETGEGGLTLEGMLTAGNEEESLIECLALRSALDTLPEREREVLLLRYYRGMTQVQTARIVGVSQVQVSRLERRALGKLREVMS